MVRIQYVVRYNPQGGPIDEISTQGVLTWNSRIPATYTSSEFLFFNEEPGGPYIYDFQIFGTNLSLYMNTSTALSEQAPEFCPNRVPQRLCMLTQPCYVADDAPPNIYNLPCEVVEEWQSDFEAVDRTIVFELIGETNDANPTIYLRHYTESPEVPPVPPELREVPNTTQAKSGRKSITNLGRYDTRKYPFLV
jgi:hypothetical protein